jgi:uncharacterized protein (TIGR02996 family)
MTDREALLAEILAHPEADLPRLVYADYIEEYEGECERAEFIRLQIKLAENSRINRSGGNIEGNWDAEVSRMRDLFFANATNWFHIDGYEGPHFSADRVLQWHGDPSPTPPTFTGLTERGFISEVRGPMEWLVGGQCGNCSGNGHTGTRPIEECMGNGIGAQGAVFDPCNTCQGTGYMPGHLVEIVKTQPVEFVRVNDKRPWEPIVAYHGANFAWASEQHLYRSQGDPWAIPEELIRLMGGSVTPTGYAFRTRAEADKALSDAMLKWAKNCK